MVLQRSYKMSSASRSGTKCWITGWGRFPSGGLVPDYLPSSVAATVRPPTQGRSMTPWSVQAWTWVEFTLVRGIVGVQWCVRDWWEVSSTGHHQLGLWMCRYRKVWRTRQDEIPLGMAKQWNVQQLMVTNLTVDGLVEARDSVIKVLWYSLGWG